MEKNLVGGITGEGFLKITRGRGEVIVQLCKKSTAFSNEPKHLYCGHHCPMFREPYNNEDDGITELLICEGNTLLFDEFKDMR